MERHRARERRGAAVTRGARAGDAQTPSAADGAGHWDGWLREALDALADLAAARLSVPYPHVEPMRAGGPSPRSVAASGTLTAGNSTPLTDGAAAVLLTSEEYALANGLQVQAWLTHARTSAVDFVGGEGLLMAPTIAVSELLKASGLSLQDFDFYEIHEAFAAQVLCTLKAWESDEFCRNSLGLNGPLGSIDRSRLNVTGSSLALGHPFAATGARILATLAKLLQSRDSGRGLISICTAGGMGAAAILEKA